ncbi:unnamed protein product, partial [Cladocopium goreaui]
VFFSPPCLTSSMANLTEKVHWHEGTGKLASCRFCLKGALAFCLLAGGTVTSLGASTSAKDGAAATEKHRQIAPHHRDLQASLHMKYHLPTARVTSASSCMKVVRASLLRSQKSEGFLAFFPPSGGKPLLVGLTLVLQGHLVAPMDWMPLVWSMMLKSAVTVGPAVVDPGSSGDPVPEASEYFIEY